MTTLVRMRRLRHRLWTRRHMHHRYLNLTGPMWRRSCGATRVVTPSGQATS